MAFLFTQDIFVRWNSVADDLTHLSVTEREKKEISKHFLSS